MRFRQALDAVERIWQVMVDGLEAGHSQSSGG
jgi:uncharacterized protein YoaH (UPF0181 family)